MEKLASKLWEKIHTEPLLSSLIFLLVLLTGLLVSVMFCETCKEWVGERLGLYTKNRILTFLGIGMGGVLLALQALMSYKRAKALEDTAKAQAEAAKAQAKATEEQAKANQNTEQGQRQERLKNAIEHLGHDNASVRLGGAYELFHLAEDTAEDTKDLRQTVLDILCAHIRRTTGEDEYREKHKSEPSEEIQSLLTLLFVQKHEVFKGLCINLQGSWLNGADLDGARLEKAVLTNAYLQRASLNRAQLDGVHLGEAKLQKADFREAKMRLATLVRADMQAIDLSGAHLQRSLLNEARLHGAFLTDAHLQETGLNGTYLRGAYLAAAHLQNASLGGAHLQGANLHIARLHGAILRDAQIQGAYLRAAQLHEVQFSSLQGLQHLNETVRQEINPEPARLQGVNSSVDNRGWAFLEYIRKRKDKETDLSGVTVSGGLTKQNVDSLVSGLSEAGARKLRGALEPHINQPVSHELPEDSGAIIGTYTEAEAEQWIVEYEKAMSEVPMENAN